ncbi:hypothetical protein U9M48_038272 [Paspalum notatum var. saurae]|uniref:Uncharacterized protein n=1 Tax=Paspalum notatum var. saurae TaxID=547442 RepID=A0AAQ3XAX7_PASNO
MVVLTEEFHGLSLKRKGADEPELCDAGGDGRSGFPLAWRATKMRRLACPDGPYRRDEPPAVDSAVTPTQTAGQGDVLMGEDAAPAPSLPGDDEKAVVVYGDAGRRGRDDHDDSRSAPRLALRAHADWVRAMLWEADSRTVRELLAGAREQGSDDLALAVVPWVPPSAAEVNTEPSTAEEATTDGRDDSEGAAAMDVEGGDEEERGCPWTGQTYGAAAEGLVYRWPQHCMAPTQMPAVAPASPVMWSW